MTPLDSTAIDALLIVFIIIIIIIIINNNNQYIYSHG